MTDIRAYTSARVALGVAGVSLPTAPLLALRLAHAKARDAVHAPLDVSQVRNWPSLLLRSEVRNRDEYLRRPDLGRKLSTDSAALLQQLPPQSLVFAVGDGLSALGVERHATPLLEQVFDMLPHSPDERSPVLIVTQARVAIGDEIGAQLKADLTVLLIGERPGLSAPDSLGVYLTWQPRPLRTDAERNCISNIHAAGLSYEAAAHKVVFLIREMYRRKLSGVALKDTSSAQKALHDE